MMRRVVLLRLLSATMLIGALYVLLETLRQTRATDDGGPPIAGLFTAWPALALLIGAGYAWTLANPKA